jgi:hypothetical protein
MRLLQLHEYVALLDGGTDKHPIGDDVSKACLSQAESIWPKLRMSSWTDRPRTVEYVARCRVTGRLLVHVSGDWKDCFLILVVPPHHSTPHHLEIEGYLLFDIGAEYGAPRLVCPAFGLDHVANEPEIRRTIPLLPGARDPFAILEIGEGTYIQTCAEGGMFERGASAGFARIPLPPRKASWRRGRREPFSVICLRQKGMGQRVRMGEDGTVGVPSVAGEDACASCP